jgi:hypothetical protein
VGDASRIQTKAEKNRPKRWRWTTSSKIQTSPVSVKGGAMAEEKITKKLEDYRDDYFKRNNNRH